MSDSAPPSEDAIREAVFEWLSKVDASSVTTKDLKRELEQQHNWNLDAEKGFLKSALLEYFDRQAASEDEEDGNDNTEIEDAVSPTPAPKAAKGGFSAPVQLSDKLSDFLGVIVLPRKEVTKLVWAYIKENNLQNPSNRKQILCDEKLKAVLGRSKIDMFQMTKVLNQNMKTVSELQSGIGNSMAYSVNNEETSSAGRGKKRGSNKAAKKNSSTSAGKSRPSSFGGLVELAAPLSELLGYSVMPRSYVMKLIWRYIKGNDRQDPSDRRYIICDEPMERVFKLKKFSMFQMTKHVNAMLTKTDKPCDYNPDLVEDTDENTDDIEPKKKKSKRTK